MEFLKKFIDEKLTIEEYNLADQTIDKMATIASKKGGRLVDFEPLIATWHTMFTEEPVSYTHLDVYKRQTQSCTYLCTASYCRNGCRGNYQLCDY